MENNNDIKNLNAELYSKQLLEEWSNKNHLLIPEEKLISKYLIDKNKSVLDAGTGGGRLAFYIENLGFNHIVGFDIVPEMIDHANKVAEEKKSIVEFKVADAANMDEFSNDSFDYSLYFQQVLNFIPEEEKFNSALKESYRITKKNGIVIFSLLDYKTRIYNKVLNRLLHVLRKIRKEPVMNQRLPWLKINNKFNWKILNKNQALSYWVKEEEIISSLKDIGYTILEVKNASEFSNQNSKNRNGMLFIVCRK